MKRFVRWAGSIALCQAAGALGGLITGEAIPTWYAGLIKPPFNPPAWLFGPVWILLYALMGIALALILDSDRRTPGRRAALSYFFIQLLLNALWTPLFFGFKWLLIALCEILLLEAMILLTARRFLRIRKAAGLLLLPYAAWVAFAAVLNLSLWVLNRG
jgi:translocator protein